MELWPSYKGWFRLRLLPSNPVEYIESFFRDMYGFEAILLSSARVGIRLALELLEVKRTQLCWIPPFSSHCVFSTVSARCTPTTDSCPSQGIEILLATHQLGIPYCYPPQDATVFEDSVDSMVVDSSALFPNKGRFEFLSLPKILGTAMGGVVLCKNRDDIHPLREIREQCGRFGAWTQSFAKRLAQFSSTACQYASAYEPFNAKLPRFEAREIASAIRKWDSIALLRKERFDMVMDSVPLLLEPDIRRLPSALPLVTDCMTEGVVRRHILRHQYIFSHEIRNTSMIPVHHQVSLERLRSILAGVRHAQNSN